MTAYIALLRKDKMSDFCVDFPEFPGCVTAGRTLDEARTMAAEALELHIAGMVEDGQEVPGPSALEDIMADPHNRDAVGFLVDVNSPLSRAIRINITLPEALVAAIDRVASNRSKFLAEAAQSRLAGEGGRYASIEAIELGAVRLATGRRRRGYDAAASVDGHTKL